MLEKLFLNNWLSLGKNYCFGGNCVPDWLINQFFVIGFLAGTIFGILIYWLVIKELDARKKLKENNIELKEDETNAPNTN